MTIEGLKLTTHLYFVFLFFAFRDKEIQQFNYQNNHIRIFYDYEIKTNKNGEKIISDRITKQDLKANNNKKGIVFMCNKYIYI